MSSDTLRRAAIDVGSNTTRLLVAELDGDGIASELARDMRITGLARGFDGRRLAADSLARVRATILEYRDLARRLGCSSVVVGFTGVARRARNITPLLDELNGLDGVRAFVLSEEQEARCSARGVAARTGRRRFLLVDVGGGSTEIAAVGDEFEYESFPVGTVELEERYGLRGVVPSKVIGEMKRDVCSRLAKAGRWSRLVLPLFANAATATICAYILLGLNSWNSDAIEGFEVGASDIERLVRELCSLDESQRVGRYPILRGRERVFICGLVVLACALEVLGRREFVVTEGSVLEGLLFFDSDG